MSMPADFLAGVPIWATSTKVIIAVGLMLVPVEVLTFYGHTLDFYFSLTMGALTLAAFTLTAVGDQVRHFVKILELANKYGV